MANSAIAAARAPAFAGRNPANMKRSVGKPASVSAATSAQGPGTETTGMPAARLRLTDRGLLREGAFADVVIFDAGKIADRSTFEDPHQYPAGIDHVLVNGV